MNPAARHRAKGEATRAQILEAAVEQASRSGFESLTIGDLAERTGLSKSGLFAHFGSKLELQVAVLDEAARRFAEAVFLPALKVPRGVRRLRVLFERWLDWPERARLSGACPIDAACHEYDHRPGPMREAVVERERLLFRELVKAVQLAIDTGEFTPGVDPGQVAFEFVGILLAFHRALLVAGEKDARARAQAAFERLLAQYAATPARRP